ETGAGQHGVATATVCARFGLDCVVHMGSEDMRRQAPNVERMKLLGAEVRPVEFGTKTLKEATSEAIRDWITNVETTYYLIGSCVGPSPYPELVRELQRVIGREAREQMLAIEGRLPEAVVACVGGGSNAIGAFYDFIEDEGVRRGGVLRRVRRAGVDAVRGRAYPVSLDRDARALPAEVRVPPGPRPRRRLRAWTVHDRARAPRRARRGGRSVAGTTRVAPTVRR